MSEQSKRDNIAELESLLEQERQKNADFSGKIAAIDKAQAVIEFNMDGTIITANDNFLSAMGYTLAEVQGQHHSMFVVPGFETSAEYQGFWAALNRGEFEAKEYKRIGKGGREVWIQASYNPILDMNGNPFKVVKYATDVTAQKLINADYSGQIDAISKAQAVIEFNMDGTIITANDNFLGAMGYTLEEVQGQHHSLFVEPTTKTSAEYREFWAALNRGEYDAKEYKRIGKGGREVWIQASYNPILDMSGKPFKVVKYATDVTAQKLINADYSGQIDAISKAQAVIEFNMDGTIITANDNFLGAMGYSLGEVQGQHHKIFVEPKFKNSVEYQQFWEKLNRGEYESQEYKRIGKGGREVWIQASYNPIFDLNGRPFKVVKYAADITKTKKFQSMIELVLSDTTAVAESLSAGDLCATMDGLYDEQFQGLASAMNSSMNNLLNMVSEIRYASSNVFSAAREIAQGNDDLSQRTEAQASNLEETAAAMEQLTTTVQQNAENASEATKLASSVMDKASSGGQVVSNAVTAMEEINTSSKKIADIIGVIDEIAFQTNLLALNAAVEAARAGEQGRGFAVVAAEVRNLAGRSAAAAKEIKSLINDSVEAVGKGTKLVDETGQTFSVLVESVTDVVTKISDINNASNEQAAGILQVSQAVSQMDQMTQQNAALVEQASASSKSMEEQSQSLLEHVGFFQIGEEQTSTSTSARTAPKRAAVRRPRAVTTQDNDEWQDF